MCLELHCLPSALRKEDYNMVSSILSIISARNEKQASDMKAAKRRDVIEFV